MYITGTDKSKAKLHYPSHWLESKALGKKISVLTAYDAWMARLLEQADIDALLVGDSLGMVVQGHSSTLPVCLEDMIYHCRMVRRGAPNSFIIGDMPFASYQVSSDQAVANAMRLVQETGIDAVKVEGGAHSDLLAAIEKLTAYGVPVMGHLGFTPQSYRVLSGPKVQGRERKAADQMRKDALLLQKAGCFALVLELVVSQLAREISESIDIPSIGLGSGPHTSGQVLVFHDFLGLNPDFKPKHARLYADSLGQQIIEAAKHYNADVKNSKFPDETNSFI